MFAFWELFKDLETKSKILLGIVIVLIIIPLVMWLFTTIHDGIIHFFGGETKTDIIAHQKVALEQLHNVNKNNDQTLKILAKKNKVDIKIITHESKTMTSINKQMNKTINKVTHTTPQQLKQYVNKTALLLHDQSVLNTNMNKPIVKVNKVITKQPVVRIIHNKKKIITTKKVTKESYVVNKKRYEVEGYKDISLIWNTYNQVKDTK